MFSTAAAAVRKHESPGLKPAKVELLREEVLVLAREASEISVSEQGKMAPPKKPVLSVKRQLDHKGLIHSQTRLDPSKTLSTMNKSHPENRLHQEAKMRNS